MVERLQSLYRARLDRDVAGRAVLDAAHRHVVGAAQHLDRNDAFLFQPVRLLRVR